jgi:two-component system, OmpR family, sensor kinase
MGVRLRVPLGVLLPCLAVCLAAIGALAVGIVGASATRAYLTRQADDDLLACADSIAASGFVAVPGAGAVSGQVLSGACGIQLRSAGGQALAIAASASRPAVPASGSWLATHLRQPVTVPGTGTGGSWRVMIEPVRYQAQRILFAYGPDDVKYLVGTHGTGGMLVVAAVLPGIGPVAGRYAAVAGAVLLLLATAAFAVVRRLLTRERNHRPFGKSPLRITERTGASRTAEAAALRSVGEMAGRLGEAGQQLRTSVSVVRGFADYCLQRGVPPPADLDRMMRRVDDEATRMESLIDGLGGQPAADQQGRAG